MFGVFSAAGFPPYQWSALIKQWEPLWWWLRLSLQPLRRSLSFYSKWFIRTIAALGPVSRRHSRSFLRVSWQTALSRAQPLVPPPRPPRAHCRGTRTTKTAPDHTSPSQNPLLIGLLLQSPATAPKLHRVPVRTAEALLSWLFLGFWRRRYEA